MFNPPSKRTIWAAVSLLFTTLIVGTSQRFPDFWLLFSNKPFFQWLLERWPVMTIAVYLYLKLLVYIAALGLLYMILKAIYRQKQDYGRLEAIADEDSRDITHRVHWETASEKTT